MRNIILLTFLTQARVHLGTANHTVHIQDDLVERALRTGHFFSMNLENTTFGKRTRNLEHHRNELMTDGDDASPNVNQAKAKTRRAEQAIAETHIQTEYVDVQKKKAEQAIAIANDKMLKADVEKNRAEKDIVKANDRMKQADAEMRYAEQVIEDIPNRIAKAKARMNAKVKRTTCILIGVCLVNLLGFLVALIAWRRRAARMDAFLAEPLLEYVDAVKATSMSSQPEPEPQTPIDDDGASAEEKMFNDINAVDGDEHPAFHRASQLPTARTERVYDSPRQPPLASGRQCFLVEENAFGDANDVGGDEHPVMRRTSPSLSAQTEKACEIHLPKQPVVAAPPHGSNSARDKCIEREETLPIAETNEATAAFTPADSRWRKLVVRSVLLEGGYIDMTTLVGVRDFLSSENNQASYSSMERLQ